MARTAAAERGAVIAGLEGFGDVARRRARSHGHACRNALCHGDDIGRNAEMLEGKRSSTTIDARLDLVAHHKSAVLVRQVANGLAGIPACKDERHFRPGCIRA